MASIKKVGENRWQVRVFLGRKNGKMKRHTKVFHGTKRDAETYARNKETARDLGEFDVEIEKITLRKWLKKWLLSKKDSVEDQTFLSYEGVITTHLEKSDFADLTLDKIKPIHIQALYDQLAETHSPRSIELINTVLSAAMERAAALEYITRNPCKLTSRPVKKRKPFKVFNVEDARQFLSAAACHKYHVLWVVALTLGLRPEEYQALQWTDVDLKNGTLKVERAYYENQSEKTWKFKPLKTAASRRTLKLSPSQIELFKIQMMRVKAIKAEQAEKFIDHNLIFPSQTGTPLNRSNLTSRHFRPLLKNAGLSTNYRLYSLRHGCATLLLAAGEKIKVVSEILGHSSVAFTMDVYQHVLDSMRDEASTRIESVFFTKYEKPVEQKMEQLAA